MPRQRTFPWRPTRAIMLIWTFHSITWHGTLYYWSIWNERLQWSVRFKIYLASAIWWEDIRFTYQIGSCLKCVMQCQSLHFPDARNFFFHTIRISRTETSAKNRDPQSQINILLYDLAVKLKRTTSQREDPLNKIRYNIIPCHDSNKSFDYFNVSIFQFSKSQSLGCLFYNINRYYLVCASYCHNRMDNTSSSVYINVKIWWKKVYCTISMTGRVL